MESFKPAFLKTEFQICHSFSALNMYTFLYI